MALAQQNEIPAINQRPQVSKAGRSIGYTMIGKLDTERGDGGIEDLISTDRTGGLSCFMFKPRPKGIQFHLPTAFGVVHAAPRFEGRWVFVQSCVARRDRHGKNLAGVFLAILHGKRNAHRAQHLEVQAPGAFLAHADKMFSLFKQLLMDQGVNN